MPDRTTLYRDCFALAVLALVVFLAVALATYDAADPLSVPVAPLHLAHVPHPTVYPPSPRVHNLCGYAGALAADAMFSWFGAAAYYVVLSLAIIDFFLLRRRAIDSPALRMLGWLASLAGIATLLAIAVPAWSPGPVIGSGGFFGALGKTMLLAHFATAGGVIIASSLTLGGLLLATDYVLIETALLLCRIAALPARAAGSKAMSATLARNRNRTDLDESLPGDLSIK